MSKLPNKLWQVYVTYPKGKRQRKSTVHVYVVIEATSEGAQIKVLNRFGPAHTQLYGQPTKLEAFEVEDGLYLARSFFR